MPSIRSRSLRMVVYANDHPPPHTHVMGTGWEIRVALSHPPALMTASGKPKAAEVALTLTVVAQHLSQLRTMWSDLHD